MDEEEHDAQYWVRSPDSEVSGPFSSSQIKDKMEEFLESGGDPSSIYVQEDLDGGGPKETAWQKLTEIEM